MDIDDYLNVDSPSDIGANALLNPEDSDNSRGLKVAPGFNTMNNSRKCGVKLSDFGGDILSGFKEFGFSVANSFSKETGDSSKNAPSIPSLSINGVLAHDMLNRSVKSNAQLQQPPNVNRNNGRNANKYVSHELNIPNTDPSFLFPALSSNETDNLDAVSSASNSPYIYPSDAISPSTGYLALDSDVDELLSVHSDLSDVSKEYQYISNLSELQELTGNVNDPLPDYVDSQFSQLQELTNLAGQSSHNTQPEDLPMPRIRVDNTNVTPPRIKIEQFESASNSSRPVPTVGTVTSTFDTTHSELSTPSTASFGFNNSHQMFLDATKNNDSHNNNAQDTQSTLDMSEQVSLQNALSLQHDLLSVTTLQGRLPLENDNISDTFDKMLEGRRNRNRSHSRSHSRSRSTSRKSISTRSLSPDERARSLSRDREHLLKLGGKVPNTEDKPKENGESTLNLIGTTKKKQAQKHPAVYACDICDKKFTRPYNLKSHLRSHTDERPYVCSVCGKAFARMHDKNRHEDLHTGKRRYVCGGILKNGNSWGCGKKFARSDALGRHFKTELGKKCILPLYEEAELEKKANEASQTVEAGGSGYSRTDGSI
ncbi:Crz1 [Kluyveromyces lactis]|nr:Crz1 [Kluyveromyces lactis]